MLQSFLHTTTLRTVLVVSIISFYCHETFAYEKPRVYLDIYPEMPQKGAKVENKFGTALFPVGGSETVSCGQNGTIGISSLKKPDIILNVTKPSRVSIFLSNIKSNVSLGLFIAAKNREASGGCYPELPLLFQGASPTLSGVFPVGEYGVWVGVLGGGSSTSQGGIYINVYEPSKRPQSSSKSSKKFQVPRGQLTFDSEGMECPNNKSKCHRYHSRKPHVPDDLSGVTIGRGYDLKRKSPEQIKGDLIAAGLSQEDAEEYAKAGCKVMPKGACEPQFTGEKAREYIRESQDKLVEITPEQQKKLFEITYLELEEDVKRTSNKDDTKDKYGEVNFKTLNPKIKDILVDLRFRGDYTPKSRELIQKHAVNNNLSAFREAMKSKYWTDRSQNPTPVPKDRFNRRIEFLSN
jgi:hypothetical protein